MEGRDDTADDEFQEKLLTFCGAVYVAPRPTASPREILANGSFGLIDTGEKRLLVTCCHVWDFYEDQRANNPDAIMAVVLGTGFKTYVFDPVLIDADRDIDLAVFEWTGGVPEEKAFFPVRQFPIPRAEVGDVIALQGFPGSQREGTETWGRFGAFFFGGVVTAVSERKVLIMERRSRSLVSVQTGESLEVFKIGGVSGSPAYTFRDGWKLAGFACAGEDTDGTLYLTHASFMKPDGTLDRSQLLS